VSRERYMTQIGTLRRLPLIPRAVAAGLPVWRSAALVRNARLCRQANNFQAYI